MKARSGVTSSLFAVHNLPTTQPDGLRRRDFLALASAGATGVWLQGLPAAFAQASLVEEPLSVGFLEGSEELASFRPLPWLPGSAGSGEPEFREEPASMVVVPAEKLALGDQELAGGYVEMCVHGLYPDFPPRRLEGFRSAYLTVVFPPPEPTFEKPAPYTAWGSLRLPARSTAAPVRFLLPLGPNGELEVLLDVAYDLQVERGSSLRTTVVFRAATCFTVDWQPGQPKLQRGIYLLGFGPEVWNREIRLPDSGEKPRYELCSLAVSFEPVEIDG